MDLHVEIDLSGLDLLHVQNVVQKLDQAVAIGVRDVQELLDLRGHGAEAARAHQPDRSHDRGHGRTQFVADGRDEFALHQVGRLARVDVHDGADHALWLVGLVPDGLAGA